MYMIPEVMLYVSCRFKAEMWSFEVIDGIRPYDQTTLDNGYFDVLSHETTR